MTTRIGWCVTTGVVLMVVGCVVGAEAQPQTPALNDLFRKRPNVESCWVSFENPTGEKGQGGKENRGAKGHAFDSVRAGETKVLLDVSGCGTIHRMWFTLDERDPEMLRALRLEAYWDGADAPAVSVPFGDFFCGMLGRTTSFENALFANPEGRSFNCYLPMPFRSAATITITNESDRSLPKLFYDIDYTLTDSHAEDVLYFHAHWRRERWTTLGEDFEILPHVAGEGRYLGAHIGVITHPDNVGWWGEGEVKMYMDGDTDYPTIVGTGTEDYIGTGWGQGVYAHRYQGCLIADGKRGQFGFYRYHIPDPVYFHKEMRVTMQQMGGSSKRNILALQEKGVPVTPVSVDYGDTFVKLLEDFPGIELKDHDSPSSAWTNVYRRDDWSAVAFFYLDSPENGLPPILPVGARVEGLLEDRAASRE